MPKNQFPSQVELIERVKSILNLTDEALAAEVAVRPETMQKYAAGYQKAGGKVMQIIARLPEMRPRPPDAQSPLSPDAPEGAEPPSTEGQLGTVLKEGTMEEVRLLRQVVCTLFRQVTARRRPPAAAPTNGSRSRQPALFEGRPRLLPALGYIAAGLPQDGGDAPAGQFVVVPEDEYPDADFALKVQGDSMVDAGIQHGDWVVMSRRREPRAGSVVAALCDNETCLKTYVCDEPGLPYLRSENPAFPPRIIPREEMQIQGVMVGKLRIGE